MWSNLRIELKTKPGGTLISLSFLLGEYMSDYNTDMAKLYMKGKGPAVTKAYRQQRASDRNITTNKKKKIGDLYLPTISINRWSKGGKISKYYKDGGNVITGR